MNLSIVILRALKGTCGLNCLAALHLAGPVPVTCRTIMDLTGYDDAAVSRGLHTLLVLGLATCGGDEHHSAWQLAPEASRLPLPLNPFLESPENRDSDPLKEEEREDETNTSIDSSLLDSADQFTGGRPELVPAAASAASAADAENRRNSAPGQTSAVVTPTASAGGPLPAKVLRSQFYAAFEAANIYLQFRRPLADALLAADLEASPEDDPAWLRQTLGWLCYAQRRLPNVQRGAIVYISLRDRLPCDPVYLPPADLPFDAALAWALRGGEPEPTDEPDETDNNLDQTFGVSETLKVSGSPEDRLWQAAVQRLGRELSPGVIEARLRPLRIMALDDTHCLLAAPTPQARDWLSHRLTDVVARVLLELTGSPKTVEFVSDS